MSTASSWQRDVNSVFPRRNAVLAIVTVSFKHEYQDRYAIVAVGLPVESAGSRLTYGDLTRLDPQTVTPRRYLMRFVICE
jgi:hypothetical protein